MATAPKRPTLKTKDSRLFRESVFEDQEGTSNFSVAGNLQKKGSNVVTPWQSRYFVAKGHYLKYYKSKEVAGKKDYCLAVIDLDLCEIKDNNAKIFEIVLLETDVTTLRANSADEAMKWVAALRTIQTLFKEDMASGQAQPEEEEEDGGEGIEMNVDVNDDEEDETGVLISQQSFMEQEDSWRKAEEEEEALMRGNKQPSVISSLSAASSETFSTPSLSETAASPLLTPEEKLASEAASLMNWPSTEKANVTLLEGGATGKTFKLSAENQSSVCLRKLDSEESKILIQVSQTLASAELSPKVLQHNSDMILCEFIDAKPVTVQSLGLNNVGDKLESVAELVAKLHKLPAGATGVNERDELSYWLNKALPSLPNLNVNVVNELKSKVNQIGIFTESSLKGIASSVVTTHGDLHPGNILIHQSHTNSAKSCLVDLEHVGPRAIGYELAYFFSVWGDLCYMAGWTPSEETPMPYPCIEARRSFAAVYLQKLGTSETVDDFLFQIEIAGLRERLRLMLIWILIAKGNVDHMMVGAVSVFLPHLDKAIVALNDVSKNGNNLLRSDIIERGLLNAATAPKNVETLPTPPASNPVPVPPVSETETAAPIMNTNPAPETEKVSATSTTSSAGPDPVVVPEIETTVPLDLAQGSAAEDAIVEVEQGIVSSPSMVAAASLPSVKQLNKLPAKEELKRQEVPEHLKPAVGEVNQVSSQALSTAPVGQERRVARRRSVTSRRCLAQDMNNTPCNCFHFRDSPFCHDHATFDPDSVRVSAGGTSQMEDVLNKALEIALDHSPEFPPEAQAEGEKVLASLPPNLAAEFSDPLECYQLQQQFKALLSFAGDTGDGLLQAAEVLSCARQVGDDLDPEKVNMDWANTLVAGVLGRDDNSPGEEGVDLTHFMDCIRQMRISMGVDRRSVAQNIKKLKAQAAGQEVEDVESDEEDEDEEATLSPWHYPVNVPQGAVPGTVLSIPLPGGEMGYAPVESDNAPGTVVNVPMSAAAVAGCVKQAVEDASSGNAAQASEMPAESMASRGRRVSCIEGAPDEPGIGAVYAAIKGRQRFCLNAFLALREASALACDLPPMQGWMLKRGDAMSVGYLNSWKLRYFRLEGTELVYYEKEPGSETAVSKFETKKEGDYGLVQKTKEEAEAQGREATDKELAAAMVKEQDEEVFKDKNCKGGINMSEIVDIQFSIKTPVSNSGAKLMVGKLAPGYTGEPLSSSLKSAELAESMVVFKVTSAKMRRYVLAVPYDQVIPVMALFAKHVHFARASLRFRREFGSGLKQGLTLSERIQWAASTHGAKIVLAGLLVVYQNKYLRDNVLNYNLYSIGPINITPARIILAMVVTKTAHDVYISAKYANREKKYGIKWQYKKDVFNCNICDSKFPTIAMRKEHQKHHCRMCGRVVCHACASTLLFYEVSGKRQRTCDFCISNGGPPEHCKASSSNQKTVFELVSEAKKEADAKKKEEKGGSQAQEAIIERNKLKRTDLADWCDWGVVPGTAPNLKKNDNKVVDTTMKYDFSIFVPTDAQPGDTIEVTLPDGVNKVITYIADNKPAGRQKISLGFGKDGVFFALPPKAGYDLKAMEAAKQRREVNAAEMAGNALKTANSIMNAAGEAKDFANMAGLKF